MNPRTALLLGTFIKPAGDFKDAIALTETSNIFDMNLKGALKEMIALDGPFTPEVKIKDFKFDDPLSREYLKDYENVVVAYLGQLNVTPGIEKLDERFENVMRGIAFALRYLQMKKFDIIYIESCGFPKIVGTAVALTQSETCTDSLWSRKMDIKYFDEYHLGGQREFNEGNILGQGQILAQRLMKSTSIADFVKTVKIYLKQFDVKITERKASWIRENKMTALLSVSRNSSEAPLILEINLNHVNCSGWPLILVGKATPFESSVYPLSDKAELHQYQYRTGMGGASCIVGCIYTLCHLKAVVKVHCILALVWNQQHDKPNKRGDVVVAMNGTSIEIDSPFAEGRLIMADALSYADKFDASAVVDVTSLSSNVDQLIGTSYIGAFTLDDHLFEMLEEATKRSGEKVWRLPLFEKFREMLKVTSDGYISNVGEKPEVAITCKSAAFLQMFLSSKKPWIHLDISAVCECKGKREYFSDWATGRSTRLLTEFCRVYYDFTECVL